MTKQAGCSPCWFSSISNLFQYFPQAMLYISNMFRMTSRHKLILLLRLTYRSGNLYRPQRALTSTVSACHFFNLFICKDANTSQLLHLFLSRPWWKTRTVHAEQSVTCQYFMSEQYQSKHHSLFLHHENMLTRNSDSCSSTSFILFHRRRCDSFPGTCQHQLFQSHKHLSRRKNFQISQFPQ